LLAIIARTGFDSLVNPEAKPRRARDGAPLLLFLAALLLPCGGAFGQPTFTNAAAPDDFVLCMAGQATPILVETNADRAVRRAAGDLADDVARVTGIKPALKQILGGERMVVVVGTLGQSPVIDRLAAEGRLDIKGVRGEWESFVMQAVRNPWPGADVALVIAGSDWRGNIYGIYQLSEMIGVSPWYWFADVPTQRQDFLVVPPGIFKQGPPAVKYRGIFLNDEDWGLRPWASKTFDPATGNIGPKTYEKIFELLLRLHANYIWPAQHPDTRAFNFYPTNKEIADLYGIVMGSSHCEQMLRDNIDEWKLPESQYNYVLNRDGVLKYWEQRVQENAKFESVWTMGMRGISDGAMPGGGTLPEKADRLLHIIQDQRDMLARWVNPDVARVPQIFCPYKEVLDLYRLAPGVPSDITLVWPDDNYGYIRQFSDARERQRTGSAGVYYHVSYWGRPEDYLWICSTPPALIGEEMTKAFDYGANKVWILNVGDLKPAELDIEFFLKLAWNPRAWNGINTDQLMEQRFARDFGPKLAPEMTAIFAEYNRLNFQRKPEHMDFANGVGIFSVMANGDEVQQRLDAWHALVARVDAVTQALPAVARDAFFEVLGYAVHGASLMNDKWLALTRYYAYTRQGRISAFGLPAKAYEAQDAIHRETEKYNNSASGKWRLMMSDDPRDQAVFKMPAIPPAPSIPASPGKLKLALEGAESVMHFSKLTRRPHFVDAFNVATLPLHWTAKPDADWMQLSKNFGDDDGRVWMTIDWSRAPVGENVQGTIHFITTNQDLAVAVSVFNPADTAPMRSADFVEDDRRIVALAAHASAFLPGKDAHWQVIQGLGYSGSDVAVFPTLVLVRSEPAAVAADSPCLQFKMWIQHPGDWNFSVRALPTFSLEAGQPQRYAIALDDEPPKIVPLPVANSIVSMPLTISETDRRWQENVLRNAAIGSSIHTVAQAGLHTLKIWMVDPGIVLDAIIGDADNTRQSSYLYPPETRPVTK
jgi:hypothetical protein